MKILLTTVFFPPQNAIASQRTYVWAREWSRAGHQVTVLTIKKDENKSDISARSFEGMNVIETKAGFIIDWLRQRKRVERGVPNSIAHGPSTLRKIKEWFHAHGFLSSVRLPDVFDFWLPNARSAIRNQLKSEDFDFIVSSFGPVASLRAGYFAKRCHPTAKWVVDFRDLWTENHVYPGFWPVTIWERWLESFYLRRADAVTTVSSPLANSLKKKIALTPIAVFENGFDPDEMADLIVAPAQGSIKFVYTGSLHPTHRNPEPFFRALAKLSSDRRSNILVVFAGPPARFLNELIEKYKLEDVVVAKGSVGRREALILQASASVLLFFEANHSPDRDGVLTGKLFEYLATGRPVWAIGIGRSSTVGRLLETNLCGKAFGEDSDQIFESLNDLIRAGIPSTRDMTAETDIVHRFDRKKIARRMLNWMANDFVAKSQE